MAKGKAEMAKVKAIPDWTTLNCVMEEYSTTAADLATRRAWLEDALAKVRAEYSREITATEEQLEQIAGSLEAFARQHRPEFSADAEDGRSYSHAAVTIGLRKHPDTVKLPHRTADQEASVDYLKIYRPELVRLVPEPDKPAILRELTEGDAATVRALNEHGIALKPGKDQFFVKGAEQ